MSDDERGLARAAQEASTSTEVLAAYAREGYDTNMGVVAGGAVRCGRCRSVVPAGEVALASLRRFEGVSDPDDMAAVAAVECPRCGARGAVVVAFGPEASVEDAEVLAAFEDRRGASGTGVEGARPMPEADAAP